jgi:hypothetical protein
LTKEKFNFTSILDLGAIQLHSWQSEIRGAVTSEWSLLGAESHRLKFRFGSTVPVGVTPSRSLKSTPMMHHFEGQVPGEQESFELPSDKCPVTITAAALTASCA